MERIPSDIGLRYRIDLKRPRPESVLKAFAEDLHEIGSCIYSHKGLHLEFWQPTDPRGGCIPNMIIDVGSDDILIADLGGHDEKLLNGLRLIIDNWNKQTPEDKLTLEKIP